MTLQQLNYAVVISETGSFSKAAEKLYVAQPSLTGAMQELEKELGIRIFHRSGRGATLTNDGAEFLPYARQLVQQYDSLVEKYGKNGLRKKKFAVTTQHYSFAVKAFVELVKGYDTTRYEFAIREGRTAEVIDDVSTLKSEIGILYLCDFNRRPLTRLFAANDLVFHHLIDCQAYVYLWRGHPLARCRSIRFDQLADYPCLSFEQGGNSPFYFAEEILSTNEYPRTIRAGDRATMLNLMIGLNGYTLCSGIICEELNGSDYTAVPYEADAQNPNTVMEIGYLVKRNSVLTDTGTRYVQELARSLQV